MTDTLIDEITHYGMPRRSGRYPWGSGKNPYQSSKNFVAYINEIKEKSPGITEKEIAQSLGMNTSELRRMVTISRTEIRRQDIANTIRLKEKGWGNKAIADHLNISEASVRAYLKPGVLERASKLENTKEALRLALEKDKYVDVGAGINHHLNVSPEQLKAAVAALGMEGYQLHEFKQKQLTVPGAYTNRLVLAPEGTLTTDIIRNMDQIGIPGHILVDGGRSILGLEPPKSVDQDRVRVVYGDEGGADADGLIKLRPGVDDLDLGASNYAQVRIAVDGTHYMKGVAVYDPNMPKGADIEYYTNKMDTGNKLDAMKEAKKTVSGELDTDNPFGASISRQSGALNVIYEEGNWDTWDRNLASQVLSKQSTTLAKQQLSKVVAERQKEFDELKNLTNPVVKKHLLMEFADSVDSDAVHLKAHAMPDQATKVIIPVNSLKAGSDGSDGRRPHLGEVYAPGYKDGTEVVLIRYPHGGIFEIPTLRVNNKNKEAQRLLGSSPIDAIAINSKVANVLSGADFDGDSVLIIPNEYTGPRKIKTSPPLEGLKNFDPKERYPYYEGMRVMDETNKQNQMGRVSNLITDMSIKGASHSEIARAVRHSMVVIDAVNHKLDWKQSELDNNIAELRKKYQTGGASTLLSRATAPTYVPHSRLRRASEGGPIDPKTGQLVYVETGETTTRKGGKVEPRTQKTKRLATTHDAYTLVSDNPTPMEKVYADHSNRLKAMANEARKEYLVTKPRPYSPTARVAYANEVSSLVSKLSLAQRHAPLERRAQAIANVIVKAKKQEYPEMDSETEKKISNQALAEQRHRLLDGGKRTKIDITPREWEAIQLGAITPSRLEQILNHTDPSVIRTYATPRTQGGFTSGMLGRARAMLAVEGVTQAQVAEALGVSVSTLTKALREGV